jgi:hypothetical protein
VIELSAINDGSVNYEINSSNHELQSDIRYDIDSWIEKWKPAKIYQWWARFGSGFAFMAAIFCLFSFSQLYPDAKENAKAKYLDQAHSLLQKDSAHLNIAQSVELLLKLSSAYIPAEEKANARIQQGVLRFTVIAVYFFLIGCVTPTPIIGLGKNKSKLQRYSIYTKFVAITIPIAFVLPPLIAWLQNWMM